MADQSLAETFLNMGGNTLTTLGTCCTSIAVLFGTNQITDFGIKLVTNLPLYLGLREATDDEKKQPIVTRELVVNKFSVFGKICSLLFLGGLIKILGKFMGRNSTAVALNQLLYGKLE